MRTARRLTQLAFLLITLVGVFVVRGHAERWCPFGGVEAAYQYVTQGDMLCALGVSNFYMLGGIALMTVLLRRAFCAYVCPIGSISEWLQGAARRLRIRPLQVPYSLDRALALLKYLVLAVILYFTWRVGELVFRTCDPCYALISRHGTDITFWAYVVSGAIVVASVVLMVPFCRWLCPLAAVLAPLSRCGLTRVYRATHACADCAACRRACPMGIRVDQVRQVTAARCTACLECIAACPRRDEQALRWGPPKLLGHPWPQSVLILLLLVCVGGAVAATYALPLPSFVRTFGTAPGQTASVRLRVAGADCRHSTEQLVAYMQRDDEYQISGYLRIEVWPQPGWSSVRIVYDPTATTEATIKHAITEPYFDLGQNAWIRSPYRIDGYDPLD